MPNFISSSYGPGTSSTSAQGPTGMDVSPFLAALLARESQFLNRRAAPARPSPSMGNRTTRTLRPSTRGGEGERSSRLKEKLLEAQASKASAEARALNSRIPTRMSTVGGQTFATPDHLQMSGAQRQVFLPQNSSFQNAPSSGGFGAGPKVYGGAFSDFENEADEEGFWRDRALQYQAAANAKGKK